MTAVAAPDVAGLLDALGKSEAAAILRWSDDTSPAEDLVDELAAANAELTEALERIGELESQLCKRCALRWRKSDG